MLDPLPGQRKPGLFGDVGPAHQAHHPFRDRGGTGRDGHPPAVAGQVGVARGVVRRPVAVPAGDHAELVERAGARAEDADQRFQQGQVDDLAAAAGRRRGGTARASPRRRRSTPATPSARPNGGRVGGPVSSPVWWASPLIASARVPNARRLAYGPLLPEPGDPQHHQRRVDLVQSLGPRPHFSITPGRKFSITTSACTTSLRRIPAPPACRSSA